MPLGEPLLAALERMRCGGIIIDRFGAPVRLNDTAARLLMAQANATREQLKDPACARRIVQQLLKDTKCALSSSEESWVAIHRDGKRPLILHSVPLDNSSAQADPPSVLILIDLDIAPKLETKALQRLFELSSAEARIAVQIAAGKALSEIAAGERISVDAARTLLAAIFAKTNTRRQGELIALLARVALLP
jgi:DNA-binding CsgD family transcriptional regulator